MKLFFRFFLIITVFLVSYGKPSEAHADSQSLVTLGFGLEMGMNRHHQFSNESESSVVAEITARLRLFHVLGASFSFNFISPGEGELSFASKFRLTGLFYIVPTRRVSIYLLGGLGSRDIRDIISPKGNTTSYHAGLGLEVYIRRRFAIHLDYMWLVPGITSIRNAVAERTSEVTEQIEDLPAGTDPSQVPLPDVSIADFLDAGNFQIICGVRFYI